MKYLTALVLIVSLNAYSQEKEGDLQLPVTDLSQVEKQEEEIPPTLDEVEMKQKEDKTKKKKSRPTSSRKTQASP